MQKMYSIRQVAQAVGVCEATVYRATWRGDLKSHRAGKQLRYTQSMIDDWIQQNATSPRKLPRSLQKKVKTEEAS